MPNPPRSRRATPLNPADRRRSIAKAVLPLLLERGASVTTRDIAEAAGVAEGTLFSVFDTKHAIILAAVELQLDPEDVHAGLRTVPDLASDLHGQLLAAANVILAHSTDATLLLSILRTMTLGESERADHSRFMKGWLTTVTDGIRALIDRHADSLSIPADKATFAFVNLLLTTSRPFDEEQPSLEASEIVDVALHGILGSVTG